MLIFVLVVLLMCGLPCPKLLLEESDLFLVFLFDSTDVSCGELMMVREVHVFFDAVAAAQVMLERQVVGYAGEHDKALGVDIARISLREDSFWSVVCDLGEE